MAVEYSRPILITGKNGRLSLSLQKAFTKENIPFVALGQMEMDITNKEEVLRTVESLQPSVILHTAAMTDVDRGEREFHKIVEVNVHGTFNLLKASKSNSCSFMYISSDYVFNGERQRPYSVKDCPSPINQYGYTKWLGEEYVRRYPGQWWIVRTSWLFGGRDSFIDIVAQKASKGENITVVDDQISTPTCVDDLTDALLYLLKRSTGIYHVTNSGECSKYELAKFIYKHVGALEDTITATTSDYWNSSAKRPRYSPLETQDLGDEYLRVRRHWQEAVIEYLDRKG